MNQANILAVLSLVDSPLVIYRPFIEITGSVNAALFLSQCLYWTQRTDDEEGWFYKARGEWTAEIGLSRWEQESAREALKSLGILDEERRCTPPVTHFKVNLTVLYGLLFQLEEKPPIKRRKNLQLNGGKTSDSLYKRTKTTTKNTTSTVTHSEDDDQELVSRDSTTPPSEESGVKKRRASKGSANAREKPTPQSPPPLGPVLERVPGFAEAFSMFMAYRAAHPKHRAMSREAINLALRGAEDAHRHGWDVVMLIEQAIVNNYAGFVFPDQRKSGPKMAAQRYSPPGSNPNDRVLKPGLN